MSESSDPGRTSAPPAHTVSKRVSLTCRLGAAEYRTAGRGRQDQVSLLRTAGQKPYWYSCDLCFFITHARQFPMSFHPSTPIYDGRERERVGKGEEKGGKEERRSGGERKGGFREEGLWREERGKGMGGKEALDEGRKGLGAGY